MKRRGFLGFMGGAAVAGPSAAKSVVTAASTVQSGGMAKMPYIGSAVGAGPSPCSEDKGWIEDEIKSLNRILRGEQTEEEKVRRDLDADIAKYAFEIETSNLHSMSEAAKLRRMKRYAIEHEQWREREWARLRIPPLLKQLAGIKT